MGGAIAVRTDFTAGEDAASLCDQRFLAALGQLSMIKDASVFILDVIDFPLLGFKPPSSDGDWLEP
jgi:hypothetical protein